MDGFGVVTRAALRSLDGVKPAPATWHEVALFLDILRKMLTALDPVTPPPADSRADAKDEAAIDVWCAGLVATPAMTIDTPENLRTWVLARILCAQHQVADLVPRRDVPQPPSIHQAAHWLLVEKWHTHGVKLWPHVRARMT